MKQDNEKYELIEKYLNQELSSEELQDFELRMKSEEGLVEEVENHRMIHELVLDQGLLDLKSKMNNYEKSIKNNNRGKLYLFSAVIFLSITATWFYFKDPQKIVNINIEDKIERPEINIFDENHDHGVEKKSNFKKKDIFSQDFTDSSNLDSVISSETVILSDGNSVSNQFHESKKDSSITNETQELAKTEQEIPKAKETVECFADQVKGKISTQNSCATYSSGKITIDANSIAVGKPPYKFSINNSPYTQQHQYNFLQPGKYTIEIMDSNGCVAYLDKEVTIGEEDCEGAREYAFSPGFGETWKFPIQEGADGNVMIFNKSGTLVYKSKIENGYPSEWRGETTSGAALPMGVYSFIIKIDGKEVTGYVSIAR